MNGTLPGGLALLGALPGGRFLPKPPLEVVHPDTEPGHFFGEVGGVKTGGEQVGDGGGRAARRGLRCGLGHADLQFGGNPVVDHLGGHTPTTPVRTSVVNC
jgi:hypothetical protein